MKNMTRILPAALIICLTVLVLSGCTKDNKPAGDNQIIVVEATGDIAGRLEEFRQLLGSQLNTAPGSALGRREINWDGIPDEMLDKPLPADFFNPTGPQAITANQRGIVYTVEQNFRVSKTNFADINANAAAQFNSFSGNKLFANVSNNKWDVEFQVAGQPLAAFVRGFGIVFSDVDQPNSTSLEYFSGQVSLGKFFVPAKTGSNFSFLGVYFNNDRVTRVRVSHTGTLDNGEKDSSDNGPFDLVALDNFLYNEPLQH